MTRSVTRERPMWVAEQRVEDAVSIWWRTLGVFNTFREAESCANRASGEPTRVRRDPPLKKGGRK